MILHLGSSRHPHQQLNTKLTNKELTNFSNAEDSYWCPVCGNSFAENPDFQRHIISHIRHYESVKLLKISSSTNLSNSKSARATSSGFVDTKLKSAQTSNYGFGETKLKTACQSLVRRGETILLPKKGSICALAPCRVSNQAAYRSTLTGPKDQLMMYKCPECNVKFTELIKLKLHLLRFHLGAFPFKCVEVGCGAAFVSKGNLQKHISVVHGEVIPYKCKQCPSNFKFLSKLQKHMRRSHPHRKQSVQTAAKESVQKQPFALSQQMKVLGAARAVTNNKMEKYNAKETCSRMLLNHPKTVCDNRFDKCGKVGYIKRNGNYINCDQSTANVKRVLKHSDAPHTRVETNLVKSNNSLEGNTITLNTDSKKQTLKEKGTINGLQPVSETPELPGDSKLPNPNSIHLNSKLVKVIPSHAACKKSPAQISGSKDFTFRRSLVNDLKFLSTPQPYVRGITKIDVKNKFSHVHKSASENVGKCNCTLRRTIMTNDAQLKKHTAVRKDGGKLPDLKQPNQRRKEDNIEIKQHSDLYLFSLKHGLGPVLLSTMYRDKGNLYKCVMCNADFFMCSHLLSHIKHVHATIRSRTKPVVSKVPRFQTETSNDKWEAPYKCEPCKVQYINHSLFLRHIKHVHGKNSSRHVATSSSKRNSCIQRRASTVKSCKKSPHVYDQCSSKCKHDVGLMMHPSGVHGASNVKDSETDEDMPLSKNIGDAIAEPRVITCMPQKPVCVVDNAEIDDPKRKQLEKPISVITDDSSVLVNRTTSVNYLKRKKFTKTINKCKQFTNLPSHINRITTTEEPVRVTNLKSENFSDLTKAENFKNHDSVRQRGDERQRLNSTKQVSKVEGEVSVERHGDEPRYQHCEEHKLGDESCGNLPKRSRCSRKACIPDVLRSTSQNAQSSLKPTSHQHAYKTSFMTNHPHKCIQSHNLHHYPSQMEMLRLSEAYYYCEHCKMVFKEYDNLVKHILQAHDQMKTNFMDGANCSVDQLDHVKLDKRQKSTPSPSKRHTIKWRKLLQHAISNDRMKNFEKGERPKTLLQKIDAGEDIDYIKKVVYRCERCNAKFKELRDLVKHRIMHGTCRSQ